MHSLNYKWNQKKLAKSEEVHKSQKPAFHAFAFWTSSSQTTSSQNRPSSFTAVFDIYDTQLQYLPSTLKYALEMAKTSPKPESFGRLFFSTLPKAISFPLCVTSEVSNLHSPESGLHTSGQCCHHKTDIQLCMEQGHSPALQWNFLTLQKQRKFQRQRQKRKIIKALKHVQA